MNKDTQKTPEQIDQSRRRVLKTAIKTAYVAPAVTLIPMEKLMANASEQGCKSSGLQPRTCMSLFG